jgi:hypothetical protein
LNRPTAICIDFIVLVTGLYTIAIGGSLSADAGKYPYCLALTVPARSALPLAGYAARLVFFLMPGKANQ